MDGNRFYFLTSRVKTWFPTCETSAKKCLTISFYQTLVIKLGRKNHPLRARIQKISWLKFIQQNESISSTCSDNTREQTLSVVLMTLLTSSRRIIVIITTMLLISKHWYDCYCPWQITLWDSLLIINHERVRFFDGTQGFISMNFALKTHILSCSSPHMYLSSCQKNERNLLSRKHVSVFQHTHWYNDNQHDIAMNYRLRIIIKCSQ